MCIIWSKKNPKPTSYPYLTQTRSLVPNLGEHPYLFPRVQVSHGSGSGSWPRYPQVTHANAYI